jgi:hypothetical protein
MGGGLDKVIDATALRSSPPTTFDMAAISATMDHILHTQFDILQSAYTHPQIITDALVEKCKASRMAGPYPYPPH